uniref:Huntingtin interacting protein 1 related n=1 Tax=Nothobranchius furzeri TaxID=105023 RepID=A0A8C6NL90_NOTFU
MVKKFYQDDAVYISQTGGEYIILGTHKEGGATTFWSYVLNLPLSSHSMVSWKFCYLLHKVLRDGHKNVSHWLLPVNLCGNLHDRYGHIVALSAKYLYLKIEFHAKVKRTICDALCLFKVLRQMDANGAKSTTSAGQCRLAPLIPLIQDCSFLYHFSVRLMFKLHSRIPPDALLGHRERFRDLFASLTQFFNRARETEFFKTIIQIPDLPDAPPNFLRAAALAEYKKPVVVMPNEDHHEEEEVETQPELREAPQVFLAASGNLHIVNRLEAEVEEQRTHKQVALVENEHLRMEVDALPKEAPKCLLFFGTDRAQAAEVRFTQLKERHAELVTSHADLMKKVISNSWVSRFELFSVCRRRFRPVASFLLQVEFPLESLTFSPQSGTRLSSTLAGLQTERDTLLRSVREQEAELNSLRQQAQLHQSSLEQEKQRSSMELGGLHAQLQQQACREGELAQKLRDEQFCLLQCAVVEAEGIILDAVAKLDDPIHVRCTSSPDYLVNRAEITLGSIDKMHQSHLSYLGNRNDASGLLRSVTQFSHLASDTIVNGAATSHSAPVDQADGLTDSCRECANHCLQFLKDLKFQPSLQRADPSAIRYTVQRILAIGQDLCPRGQDVLKEELGEMVDKEMIATSTAIEEAVLRMDEILTQTRRDTSGLKLEVNQSILGSCSDLMKAVHMLVTAATDLQKDIVEGGRGAASVTEFYAKNSRWTEGLISASKAVGWGATQLLDSADRVVTEKGSYEELIACSNEIAASTAQLVAASKVKADRSSKKLCTVQQASRHVNDMAAVVVTSTKHGQQQISDQGVMDFSGMSLIKLKKEEMEAQVRLELTAR